MSNVLDEMYRDIIMDHYRYPRGTQKIDTPDVENAGRNPSCGDEIEMYIKVNHDVLQAISIGCTGCAISIASGSMLTEIVKGKTLEEVKKIAAVVRAMIKGEDIPEDIDIDLGDLEALKGVKKFPVRVKCALLSWTTLAAGIEALEKKKPAGIVSTE